MRGVSKRFGPVVALAAVDATFEPGEIHAVLGENGAGKSTLMGVLSGFVTPDTGEVTLDDQPLPVGRPFECRRRGVEMIHQHFTLVPAFSVAENLALARLSGLYEPARVGDRSRPGLAAAERLGWAVTSDRLVQGMPVGDCQRLEILKALSGEARVLIFDEPTAVLSPDEVEDLFRVLRTLRDEGRTIILIAHKLSEVLAIADRVTVLRRGAWVATAPRNEVDATKLAEWMVGELPPARASRTDAPGEIALAVHRLTALGDRGEAAVQEIDFEVRRGEIYGVGGVDGNGQTELAETIAGVRKPASGSIERHGIHFDRVGFIPPDRRTEGLALGLSIQDNLLVGAYRRSEFSSARLLKRRTIREWATRLMARFDVRADRPETIVGTLSGGNQQKVVVSRVLDAEPELLVAVNPTRGLDIRAADFVHTQIVAARDRGVAVLLVSTDLDELFALSDRTAFMSRGRLVEGQDAAALLGGSA